MPPIKLILCACPDATSAQSIADTLVEQHLAACVTILPGATSVYRWQGKREQSQELILLIKSTAAVYDKLEQAVLDIHPDELPELIVVPIEHGLEGYLGWVHEETASG